MKITEKELRSIIRETIAEAGDPNAQTGIGSIIGREIKDQVAGQVPGLNYLSKAKNLYADRKAGSTHFNQVLGFRRACEKFVDEYRNKAIKGEHIDVTKIFNRLLKSCGVTMYELKDVQSHDESEHHAGEFSAID